MTEQRYLLTWKDIELHYCLLYFFPFNNILITSIYRGVILPPGPLLILLTSAPFHPHVQTLSGFISKASNTAVLNWWSLRTHFSYFILHHEQTYLSRRCGSNVFYGTHIYSTKQKHYNSSPRSLSVAPKTEPWNLCLQSSPRCHTASLLSLPSPTPSLTPRTLLHPSPACRHRPPPLSHTLWPVVPKHLKPSAIFISTPLM